MSSGIEGLPYKIAVLCYLYDDADRVLLLHRLKHPNADMYSPIGGKLEVAEGEGPHDCAIREIREEAGIRVSHDEVRMCGIVSETAYEHTTHWLIFLFEVMRTVSPDEVTAMDFDEGRLEWVPIDDVETLRIPETDKQVMWPLVRKHRQGFFAVHIDCSEDPFTWSLNESATTSDHRA